MKNGKSLEITFISHASLMFTYDGSVIYIDPNESFVKYPERPKGDFILITHGHSDHFDTAALKKIITEGSVIFCTQEVKGLLSGTPLPDGVRMEVMKNGSEATLTTSILVKAVPAHNLPERVNFHPVGRDNGYILNFDGFKVYVAGDTEDIPELAALSGDGIDVAFLPVNQPYTMTVSQAVRAVKLIAPAVFYPYHFGNSGQTTDIEELERSLDGSGIEVRVRKME